MFEIISNDGLTSAVVLKYGTKVYQGDAEDAQEYVLEQLDVYMEQDQKTFDKHWEGH